MSEPVPVEAVGFDPVRPVRSTPATVVNTIVLRFGAIGLNAVSGIVTARALQAEGRGHLAAMIIWPALLAWLTTFGLPSALTYHLRREPKDASALVAWAVVMCIGGAALGTLVGWYVLPLWLRQQPEDVTAAAQLCLLTTVFSSLTLLGRAAWESQGQFGRSNAAQVLAPLTVVIGLLAMMPFRTLTPFSAAAIYVLAGVPTLIWMLVSVVRTFHPTLAGGARVRRRLFHYGVRSYGVDLCGVLSVYMDQALVVGLLSPESMGIYVVALSITRMIGAVHSAIGSIVFPRVVGLVTWELTAAVARSARMALIASGALGLLVIVTGPTLLRWLYGPSFGGASTILPILVCEILLGGTAFILLQSFLAAGRPGIATMIQIISLAIGVPIFLTLVPAFGVVGAALALMTSSAIRLTLATVAHRVVLGVSMPRLWIDSSDIAHVVRYRGTLMSSLGRLRAAGEVK